MAHSYTYAIGPAKDGHLHFSNALVAGVDYTCDMLLEGDGFTLIATNDPAQSHKLKASAPAAKPEGKKADKSAFGKE